MYPSVWFYWRGLYFVYFSVLCLMGCLTSARCIRVHHWSVPTNLTTSIVILPSTGLEDCIMPRSLRWACRDHFVHAPSQWETMLHFNVVSHWLGAYAKYSLSMATVQEKGWFSFLLVSVVCLWMVTCGFDGDYDLKTLSALLALCGDSSHKGSVLQRFDFVGGGDLK